MSIVSIIKARSLEARKAKDKMSSFWITLLSEIQMVGKNAGHETTDEEAIKVLKRFKANAEQMVVLGVESAADELVIIEEFLPQMLTEDELTTIIGIYVGELAERNMKAMGAIMARLRVDYPGCYDGTLASSIIKKLLQ